VRRERRGRRLQVNPRVPGCQRQRGRFAEGQRLIGPVVDEQAPNLLEVKPADQLLDVDPAVAKRAAVAVGLGDFGGKGVHALQTIVNFHTCHPFHVGVRSLLHCPTRLDSYEGLCQH
jgi:hypothetical protein